MKTENPSWKAAVECGNTKFALYTFTTDDTVIMDIKAGPGRSLIRYARSHYFPPQEVPTIGPNYVPTESDHRELALGVLEAAARCSFKDKKYRVLRIDKADSIPEEKYDNAIGVGHPSCTMLPVWEREESN